MHIVRRFYIAAMALGVSALLWAGPVDEGKRLYESGDYQGAIEQLRAAVRRSPRDGNANYYLGASLYALGDYSEAMPYIEKAAERGVTDAYALLVRRALDVYDPASASLHIENWRTRLARNRRSVPPELEELAARSVAMRNMLARVEKIEVLDSIVVPKEDFFMAYRLSSPAGRILPSGMAARMGVGADGSEIGLCYMPENRGELLWSQTDTAGVMQLYGAGILDDGTPEHPAPLDAALGEGGNAAYPFLMPDGVTLYFANDGENSLGGYDIFMTRRDHDDSGNSYYQPQNMGMPYNSPYDDYMLAIDENSGLGWFATDRNQIPDSVTVYVFAPSEMRVNVDPEDENLVALARLSDISLTRRPGVDYETLLATKLPERNAGESGSTSSFVLDMGNGSTYTTLADFRNAGARSAMVEYLGAEMALQRHLQQEQELRRRWAAGDRTVAEAILDSEHRTSLQRRHLTELRNAVIRQETRH